MRSRKNQTHLPHLTLHVKLDVHDDHTKGEWWPDPVKNGQDNGYLFSSWITAQEIKQRQLLITPHAYWKKFMCTSRICTCCLMSVCHEFTYIIQILLHLPQIVFCFTLFNQVS